MKGLGISSLLESQLKLIQLLKEVGYRFVPPTPASHARVLKRPSKAIGNDLRDVLGWSLPFAPEALPEAVLRVLQTADALIEDGAHYRSIWRVASLGEDLFIHSAFPPQDADAVFFGPDTYRFARLIAQATTGRSFERVIDIGTGAGAGAVAAARAAAVGNLILTDLNPVALEVARANLAAAQLNADFRLGAGLNAVSEHADLIIANPPFIDGSGQTYSDGGGANGAELSLDWTLNGLRQLRPGGRLVLYTGAAIVGGVDALHQTLTEQIDSRRFGLVYEEIDPDIFGEQLSAEGYEDVDRIAAVGAVITRR